MCKRVVNSKAFSSANKVHIVKFVLYNQSYEDPGTLRFLKKMFSHFSNLHQCSLTKVTEVTDRNIFLKFSKISVTLRKEFERLA